MIFGLSYIGKKFSKSFSKQQSHEKEKIKNRFLQVNIFHQHALKVGGKFAIYFNMKRRTFCPLTVGIGA